MKWNGRTYMDTEPWLSRIWVHLVESESELHLLHEYTLTYPESSLINDTYATSRFITTSGAIWPKPKHTSSHRRIPNLRKSNVILQPEHPTSFKHINASFPVSNPPSSKLIRPRSSRSTTTTLKNPQSNRLTKIEINFYKW